MGQMGQIGQIGQIGKIRTGCFGVKRKEGTNGRISEGL